MKHGEPFDDSKAAPEKSPESRTRGGLKQLDRDDGNLGTRKNLQVGSTPRLWLPVSIYFILLCAVFYGLLRSSLSLTIVLLDVPPESPRRPRSVTKDASTISSPS